jgi:methylmalonyl-CoA/ethylmalonyl-CoA epimerase
LKLNQVALAVKDLAAAVGFHRDVLGLKLLFEVPNLAFFDMGGVRLMLSGDPSEGAKDPFVLYYKVDDLPAAWKELMAKGATPEQEPHLVARMPDHELHMGFVRDSEGRLTGIMTEVRG